MAASAKLLHSSQTHRKYVVNFDDDCILTTLTHDSNVVDNWLDEIYRIHHFRLHKLIVGLDVEWRPSFKRGVSNPVATLQLCVGRRCLIYQLIYHNGIPQSLVEFLNDPDYTFVGVGIHGDVAKLVRDYGLGVANAVNLQELAADVNEDDGFLNMGLKTMTDLVLDKEVNKPQNIRLSNWGVEWLSSEQVVYACLDAFLSFEIGRVLKLQE